MALKTIDVKFDAASEENLPDWVLYRGDNVTFHIIPSDSSGTVDFTQVVKVRLIANPFVNGAVVLTDGRPFFAGEVETTEAPYDITFSSGQTAVPAGTYLLSIVLLDAEDQIVTCCAINFKVIESGYPGIFVPTPDFRDDVIAARDEAIAAKDTAVSAASVAAEAADAAALSESSASASATNAYNSEQAALAAQGVAESARDSAQGYSETATTQAGIATAQAEIATTKASEASGSADAALESKNAAATSAQNASNSEQTAEDSSQSAQDAQSAAEAARDIALQTAESLAGAVQFKGVTASAAAPSSPANGDLWLIGVAGTWGGITWGLGDYAVYVSASSAWKQISMATVLAGEQSARRSADISRRLVRDVYGACARIPAITPPSMPFWFLVDYDLANSFGTDIYCFFTTRTIAGGNTAGVILFVQSASLFIEIYDGTGAYSQVTFAKSLLTTSFRSMGFRVLGTWASGVTGRLQAELYVDTVLAGSGIRTISGLSTTNFSGGLSTHPVTLSGGTVYTDNATGSTVRMRTGRAMLYYGDLPLTKSAGVTNGTYYSLEQFDAGEDPPAALPVFYLKDIAGGQWRDASLNRTHAYIEATAALPNAPVINTATLTWTADGTPKAFLSGTNNVIPAGSKITVSAKSTANVDVVITDGAASPTTLISSKSLIANVWQELGTAFVTTACKLAIDPTVFTGSISVQVKIEPLS